MGRVEGACSRDSDWSDDYEYRIQMSRMRFGIRSGPDARSFHADRRLLRAAEHAASKRLCDKPQQLVGEASFGEQAPCPLICIEGQRAGVIELLWRRLADRRIPVWQEDLLERLVEDMAIAR
jgi:hypothetical protein